MNQLEARIGKTVNVSMWFGLFGFDTLFDVGFGQDKQRIDRGEEDDYVTCAQQTLKLIGLTMHIPWILYFTSLIPTVSARLQRFRAFSHGLVGDRLNGWKEHHDIFNGISRSYTEIPTKTPQDLENLAGDADLLVLAGSDSIAGALSNILYHLAINVEEQNKLRIKLRHELADSDDDSAVQLQGSEHLDAVIYESLRVNPPAPAGHERLTPPEGLWVGETYIPGNISVFIPHYALFRGES